MALDLTRCPECFGAGEVDAFSYDICGGAYLRSCANGCSRVDGATSSQIRDAAYALSTFTSALCYLHNRPGAEAVYLLGRFLFLSGMAPLPRRESVVGCQKSDTGSV